MARQSAGILLYRLKKHEPEVFLVHPGGPFWSQKDAGVLVNSQRGNGRRRRFIESGFQGIEEETGSSVRRGFYSSEDQLNKRAVRSFMHGQVKAMLTKKHCE